MAETLSSTSPGGPLTDIYYLGEHDPVSVVRAFCDVNPNFVEEKSRTGFVRLFGNHGSEFKEAAREVADEIGLEGKAPTGDFDTRNGVECPRCGEEVPDMPGHLRNGCDG